MIFISLTTEAFQDQLKRVGQTLTNVSTRAGKSNVRRPLRGIEVQEDTFAYIKMIRSNGTVIPLFDSGSDTGFSEEYSNFILRGVTEQRMEKQQIIETFGEPYVFFFGESARFLQISAVVLDTLDFPWLDEFEINYAKYLRGTKAVEQGARCYLFYASNIFEGYIINCSHARTAEPVPAAVELQFQFFVTNHSVVTFMGNGQYPLRSSAVLPDGISVTEDLTQDQVNQLTGGRFAASRTKPLRGSISDNVDEFTGFDEQVAAPSTTDAVRQRLESVPNLNDTVGDIAQAYGVDPNVANSPTMAENLGFAPSFTPQGVGIGGTNGNSPVGGATFAPTANNLSVPGGFSGIKLANQNTSFGSAYLGTGVSSRSGAFTGLDVGSNLGSGAFEAGAEGTILSLAGSGVGARGLSPSTDRLSGKGVPPSSSAYAKADQYQRSFANKNARKAALAGGYAGAGALMGTTGNLSVGASNAGSSGAGPTIHVGGVITAFAFTVVPGELQNAGIPIQLLTGF